MDEMTFMQFRDRFINEARQLLVNLENSLLELEHQPNNKEMIENVFRVMHTLKGISGMYGFDIIGDFTHNFESIYQLVRDDKTVLTNEIFNLTFQSVDHINNLLNDPGLENEENKNIHLALNEQVKNTIRNLGIQKEPEKKEKKNTDPTDKCKSLKTWYIQIQVIKQFDLRSINIVNLFFDLTQIGKYHVVKGEPDAVTLNNDGDLWRIFLATDANIEEIEDIFLFILDECKIIKLADEDLLSGNILLSNSDNPVSLLNENTILELIENQKISSQNKTKQQQMKVEVAENNKKLINSRISVHAEKLDTLMFLVSELVTTKSELQLSLKSQNIAKIAKVAEKIDKLSKQFRDNALDIRLVPISDLIIRFKRLVRDLSQSLDKKIDFVIEGGDTELDKSIIDSISEPLMHIIRNCIDHGIETPEMRIKSHKPETGIIKFTSYQEGSSIIIAVEDDGKGIDANVVMQKAIEKGFISSDAKLSEKEIYNLIFLPGLSTAESLTQVSGRGVGMDIVKKKLAELGAQIDISSDIGVGTKFTIKLHQTIAILDTLLFRSDDMHLLIPLSDVEECNLINKNTLEAHKATGTVPYNNKLIPYIDIYKLYNLKTPDTERLKLIILNKQDSRFAIAADVIIGEHQAVLKSIGKQLKKQDNISAASIMGDGNLAFLLDLNSLQKINYETQTF